MWTFIWWVCSSIASALLSSKPPDAKASSSGDFDLPTAEEGRPLGLLFGTCEVSGPNVTWSGDLKVKAVKKSTSGFFGIGSKSYTVAWKYYFGMQMALGCEVEELVDIIVGDKSLGVSASYAEGGTTLHIDKPNLFGGEEKEGGISGDIDFYFGSDTQLGNSYLAGVVGSAVPGYRGVCHAILKRVYIGTQPYLKTWKWVLRNTRVPDGFSGQGNINGDANPAFIIATLLTRSREKGGRGVPIARIDVASFNAGAATHAAEGFGLSINMDKAQSADNWIQEVCSHVDAAVYTDQETGLITYKPIRADYDPATIPEFGPADMKDAPEITRPSWSETLNRVVIRYNSRANGFVIATAQDRDPANRAIRGEEALGVFDFLGASNATVAQMIATRKRRTYAYPLASLNLTMNRRAWKLRPGSPFRVVFPPLDLSMICRVANIRYGTFESGAITIEAVEDIFVTPPATYNPPPTSTWTEVISAPIVASQQALIEAPYWLVAENRHVLVMGARGDETTQSMDLWVNSGSGYLQVDSLETPTPTGLLAFAWSCKTAALDPAGFVVSSGTDLDHLPEYSTDAAGCNRGTNLALIGGTEWVSWTTATDNGDDTTTIAGVLRGVLDTVPVDHAAGERVWFASQGCTLLPSANTSGGVGSQGPTGGEGPKGDSFVWKGAWDSDVSYQPLDSVSRNGSSYTALMASVGQDPSTSPTYWQVLAQKGDPGVSTFVSESASVTATELAPGAIGNVQMTIRKSAALHFLTTDFPAWVRVYGTSEERSADSSRLPDDDALAGTGCYLDADTYETLTLPLSLPVPGFVNGDSPRVDIAYVAIMNLDTQTRDITTSIIFLPQEA